MTLVCATTCRFDSGKGSKVARLSEVTPDFDFQLRDRILLLPGRITGVLHGQIRSKSRHRWDSPLRARPPAGILMNGPEKKASIGIAQSEGSDFISFRV